MSAELTFRQRYVSRPVLNWVRGVLPAMSETEREALDAGTVGWEADLLRGDPDFSKLLGSPTRELSARGGGVPRRPDRGSVPADRRLEDHLRAPRHPGDIWDFLKAHGFLGLVIPKQYGGKGFSATANSAIVMKIASRGPSAAVAVIVPNSLGPGELLLLFGTEEQKDYWLPRLADGREIPAFALTSLDAGSDAASMSDSGVVCWGEVGARRRWACGSTGRSAIFRWRRSAPCWGWPSSSRIPTGCSAARRT
jgi:acyl-CoA dehydrogenase